MKLIAHRGNTNGPSVYENAPLYIEEALANGFDVEVDVRVKDNKLFLGHDNPTYQVQVNWLSDRRLWCHAKDIRALHLLLNMKAHCFWHEEDAFTLTSQGYIWTYPGQEVTNRSAIVVVGREFPVLQCAAICSDYVGLWPKTKTF